MPHVAYVVLVSFEIVAGAVSLVVLLFVAAPYGRHNRGGWGPAIDSRLAWILMELPAVVVIAVVYVGSGRTATDPSAVFLFLWEAHYVYRTFVFPAFLRGSRKTFPLALVFLALGFNAINGYVNGYALFLMPASARDPASAGALTALAVYFGGMATHVWADHRIRNLRGPGDGGYRIPQGGLFRLISNPNYLGEIIQWAGWALLTRTPAGLAFAWFTHCLSG